MDADTNGTTSRRKRRRTDSEAQPHPRRPRRSHDQEPPDPPLEHRPFLDALAELLAQAAIRRVMGDQSNPDSK